MTKRESITHRGTTYHRYPDAPHASDRRYFQAAAGGAYLHRVLWEEAHGPIPPGHHIHHRDGDQSNNALANLACLPKGEHKSLHGAERTLEGEHLAKMLDRAAEWHASDAGAAWHSEHAKRTHAIARPRSRRCDHCGKVYETKQVGGRSRFCHQNCKAAARRARLKVT